MATYRVSITLEAYSVFGGWRTTTVAQTEEADSREVAVAKVALEIGAYNADRGFRVVDVNAVLEGF
jgi:hypothetical protein